MEPAVPGLHYELDLMIKMFKPKWLRASGFLAPGSINHLKAQCVQSGRLIATSVWSRLP